MFHRFKSNELRLILLFAAPVFKRYLTPAIYRNYLLIVFAFHLAESRSLKPEDVEAIRYLSGLVNILNRKLLKNKSEYIIIDTFLYEYPLLYTKRHNQQVIHSIYHVAQTVQNYGQLSNYSTYNFESVLGNKLVNHFSIAFSMLITGMLRATVYSTKHHATEIANTMNLLRLAIRNTLADDFVNELKTFLEQVQKKKRINPTKLSMKPNRNPDIKLQMKHKIAENQYNDIRNFFTIRRLFSIETQ